jgi:hypothetical protein
MNFRRIVSSVTAISLLVAQLFSTAQAAVVQTQQYLDIQNRAALIATIDAALERDDVRKELVALGVDADAALARVAALSDAELEQLAGQLETLPAGGDSALAVIGIVFLVLLILELTGIINIFHKP